MAAAGGVLALTRPAPPSEDGPDPKRQRIEPKAEPETEVERTTRLSSADAADRALPDVAGKLPFYARTKFRGSVAGYVFGNRAQGLGYYVDAPPPTAPAEPEPTELDPGLRTQGVRRGRPAPLACRFLRISIYFPLNLRAI
jgi:hypothetical protein